MDTPEMICAYATERTCVEYAGSCCKRVFLYIFDTTLIAISAHSTIQVMEYGFFLKYFCFHFVPVVSHIGWVLACWHGDRGGWPSRQGLTLLQVREVRLGVLGLVAPGTTCPVRNVTSLHG